MKRLLEQTGAGANGTVYEHIGPMADINGGSEETIDMLMNLFTGNTSKEFQKMQGRPK